MSLSALHGPCDPVGIEGDIEGDAFGVYDSHGTTPGLAVLNGCVGLILAPKGVERNESTRPIIDIRGVLE